MTTTVTVTPWTETSHRDDEWTVKVVKVSAGLVRGYPQWVLRLVECRAYQRGYKTEKGVKILRESEKFYRSQRTPRSYEYRTRKYFEELAERYRVRAQLGLAYDTPDGVVNDFVLEHGYTREAW